MMSDIRRRRSASEIGSLHTILFIGNLNRGIYKPKKWLQNWNRLHRENLPNIETFQLCARTRSNRTSNYFCNVAGWLQFMSTCADLEAVQGGAATEGPVVVPLINLVS